MNNAVITSFQRTVLDYYEQHGRHDLPWRQPDNLDPYRIMVSEIMLQQTQVARVVPKYLAFLEQFPSVAVLAATPLADVLTAWSGLGYNRRARFLHLAAQAVVHDFGGTFPATVAELVRLPGVGFNTAGAIAAYAFDAPVTFIETNIRSVYIHYFFADRSEVADKELLPFIEAAVDHSQPRLWYWALMDYGTFLKQTVGNTARASASYKKQSKFEGSKRQIRGRVIKLLTVMPQSLPSLLDHIDDERLEPVLHDLLTEGLISRSGNVYHL